jgi:PII-like signaling protein
MLQAQIFLDEDDRFEEHPLYEYILRYLMHHGIVGATLFRGTMGFGSQHHLNVPGRLGALDDRPLMITFIDDEDRVRSVLPHLASALRDGMIVTAEVHRW